MKRVIIHLSDLHFRLQWEEDQELVLASFFKDLEKQIGLIDKKNILFIFSGDIVLAGGDSGLYQHFLSSFNHQLLRLGIPINQRICIPGNHDVSVKFIEEKFLEHEGILKQGLDEKQFNDYISKPDNLFFQKFSNYKLFEQTFSNYGLGNSISGMGYDIDDDLGVYCLNTALCSSGGFNQINDHKRLLIDTREIHKWLLQSKARCKVLIMHHPIEWLTDWAGAEIRKLLNNHFSLCLSGHVHDQSFFHFLLKGSTLIECSAPPLLTNKKGRLGYSLITIDREGVIDIQYRQWTKNQSFVTGVDFSDTDDGRVIIRSDVANELVDNISEQLTQKFNEALRSFSSQPLIWVEPNLSRTSEIQMDADDDIIGAVSVEEIVSTPKSLIIYGPPQFGLTSLARYLALQAWKNLKSIWLYIDYHCLKPHNVEKVIKNEAAAFNVEADRVSCIILDSWSLYGKDAFRILKTLSDAFKDIPLIVMQTIDDSKYFETQEEISIEREFEILYLLPLTRSNVRQVVCSYNKKKYLGEEDMVLKKVVSDLEVLNIHRTPLNCITLLKVCEKYFDESPVNRTKMLEMVLFLLFNMDGIPTYKSKPDLKDCEYVLGCFCEKIIKGNFYAFSREDFLKEMKSYCDEKLISLDVDVVFDILFSNNILIRRDNQFIFRFAYWIYYFAAQRMHHDKKFAEYFFDQKRYTLYPEIIEFYTGIDRNRFDALRVLVDDLKNTCDIVHGKVGLPENINPYKHIIWNPDESSITKMQQEISENVLKSKLPDSIKDKYADKTYNPAKPYYQNIQNMLIQYSIPLLMQSIKACARALRNSDFVEPELKKEMLKEILRGWDQLSMVLLAIAPVLAEKNYVTFEGQGFLLAGNFGSTQEEKLNMIIRSIPTNITCLYKDDLFSNKMGPLLYSQMTSETSELIRHELALLIIYEKPKDWKKCIENYIVSVSKNSYYLFHAFSVLRKEYRYSFSSPEVLREMEYLIKLCLAKHEFGDKKPGLHLVRQISNKVLPKNDDKK